ncbi:MAG: calcium/sodium antiporter [Bacteroides sp.]|jgi:cation:H+ antiporter|nr:calcium/sodium antiporter [Bacteroides sp.]
MITYILFIAGFFFLIFGAQFLVDGAASIAKKHGISNIVIGLTIVALGTSSPELVVNLIASYSDADDVAMGNILGSNISNILLILGVSALIFPLAVNVNHKWRRIPFALEIPIAIAAALIIGILANDNLFRVTEVAQIDRLNGLILIVFFIGFMIYAFRFGNDGLDEDVSVKSLPLWLSLVMILLGIGGLALGGKWIVEGAVKIASLLGMSEALISLTIVAVGTSLPELATCVVAAHKRNAGIVIGNIVGSNIFNIFFVVGLSAVIQPLKFNKDMNFDVLVGLFSTLLLFFFMFTPRKNILERWQGGVLFLLYVVYIIVLILHEAGLIGFGFLAFLN